MEIIEALIRLVLVVVGWPLRLLRRSVDRQPHRDPSQMTKQEKAGRLALAVTAGVVCLLPFAWLIFR
jgi:hypothetical protein